MGRKMGHLNITGPSMAAVRATAAQAAKILGIKPFANHSLTLGNGADL